MQTAHTCISSALLFVVVVFRIDKSNFRNEGIVCGYLFDLTLMETRKTSVRKSKTAKHRGAGLEQ
jgi:membrane protein CcdC involved in cytochrome C biogenesis